MPKPLPLPWAEIEAKIREGVSLRVISQTYGVKPQTICMRSKRGGWRVSKRAVGRRVESAIQREVKRLVTTEVVSQTIREWTERVHQAGSQIVNGVLKAGQKEQVPRELAALANALESADKTVGRRLGLDQQQAGAAIQINFALLSGGLGSLVVSGGVDPGGSDRDDAGDAREAVIDAKAGAALRSGQRQLSPSDVLRTTEL